MKTSSMSPKEMEEVVDDLLQKLPEQISISEMRNLVCELLFGLGLHPNDLPIFMLMVVDSYMGERRVDMVSGK